MLDNAPYGNLPGKCNGALMSRRWANDELARVRADRRAALDRITTPVHIILETERLLRKGRRYSRLEEQLRSEVRAAMGDRPPFDGDVAVDIAVMTGDDKQPPMAPPVVKAYIDLLYPPVDKTHADVLCGPVIHNDCQVVHLDVSRLADDHPFLVAGRRRYGESPARVEPALARPQVLMTVEPVELYRAAFDRAWRCERDGEDRWPWRTEPLDHETSPWTTSWSERDYVALEERDKELRQARRLGSPGADFLADLREGERSRLLLDNFFGPADRPGPLPDDAPRFADSLRIEAGCRPPASAYLDHLLHRHWPGGVFHLPPPAPHDTEQWQRDARAAIDAQRARWAGFRPGPDARLAIDLAVRDTDAASLDLDNLASRVLAAFEDAYCQGRKGIVVRYRAYRAAGNGPALCVRVFDEAKMRLLDDRIDRAQDEILKGWDEHATDLGLYDEL